jgi:hypothetical protein
MSTAPIVAGVWNSVVIRIGFGVVPYIGFETRATLSIINI